MKVKWTWVLLAASAVCMAVFAVATGNLVAVLAAFLTAVAAGVSAKWGTR